MGTAAYSTANPALRTEVVINGQTADRSGVNFVQKLVPSGTGPKWEPLNLELVRDSVTQSFQQYLYVPPVQEILTYDVDSNLTGDGRWTYAWDGENRLVGMTTQAVAETAGVPGLKLNFAYDGLSRRVQKKVEGRTTSSDPWVLRSDTRFVYDGWNMVGEAEYLATAADAPPTFGGGTAGPYWRRTYVWGEDLSDGLQGAGGVGGLILSNRHERGSKPLRTCWVTSDLNGNVIGLVENNLKAVYEFDPFGKPLRVSEPEEELNPFRFSTKYTDAETGLCYYGYRYYDAVRGRWINRDPIGEQGGPNLQAVVRNKIVNEWDYLGLREDIPAGADKPITYTDKVENAKQRNQYWEYLQDSEQSRAIFDEAVYDPPASGITPDKKSYDAGSYGCCTRAKIAEGKAALKKAFMESGIDPKTFRSEHGIQPSCYNCNKVLSSFMKCGSCWSCFMENRRWKREGVKDHWVVTCYAVGSSGIVVDRAIFDKTGGQTDVESFRKTWDLLWDIEDTGLWKAPRPCPKL